MVWLTKSKFLSVVAFYMAMALVSAVILPPNYSHSAEAKGNKGDVKIEQGEVVKGINLNKRVENPEDTEGFDLNISSIPGVSDEEIQTVFRDFESAGYSVRFYNIRGNTGFDMYKGDDFIKGLKMKDNPNWKVDLVGRILQISNKQKENDLHILKIDKDFDSFYQRVDGLQQAGPLLRDGRGNVVNLNPNGETIRMDFKSRGGDNADLILNKRDGSKEIVKIRGGLIDISHGSKNDTEKKEREVVMMPRIEFKKNPKNRDEVIAKGRELEAFKDKLLEGIDMSKVEDTQEYKDVLQTIDELIYDKSLYTYLKNATPIKLEAAQIEVRSYIYAFTKLIDHLK